MIHSGALLLFNLQVLIPTTFENGQNTCSRLRGFWKRSLKHSTVFYSFRSFKHFFNSSVDSCTGIESLTDMVAEIPSVTIRAKNCMMPWPAVIQQTLIIITELVLCNMTAILEQFLITHLYVHSVMYNLLVEWNGQVDSLHPSHTPTTAFFKSYFLPFKVISVQLIFSISAIDHRCLYLPVYVYMIMIHHVFFERPGGHLHIDNWGHLRIEGHLCIGGVTYASPAITSHLTSVHNRHTHTQRQLSTI